MKMGTKSLLFGVHQFFIHPLMVLLAWIVLYRSFPGLKELVCIFIHDWGYWGKADLKGEEGCHKDIVQDHDSGIMWTIEWHDEKGSWFLQPMSEKLEPWAAIGIEHLSDFRIIGNEFENPKLLGDK